MKNAIIPILIIFITVTSLLYGTPEEKVSGAEYQVIPDEAIRLRILADSNDDAAQALKREVRDRVNAEITTWVESLTSIEAARILIQSRLGEIEEIVGETVADYGVKQSYQVDYGKSVKFPTKMYGSYIYPAGEYEAILITIGEGEGDNWWCVLFPPLCFLDFSNGASVAEAAETEDSKEEPEVQEQQEEEVEFFLVKLWNKLFS
ncbi:stage II sporulation protein R [Halobacillus sp. Marseille-Q1614]|uniref:stage II sporulation protein R n=1 Tax=Halobacillus sp. Marseille-Q1614 TaxID=2709134 RepID=UPI00156DE0F3|nr:stage II sporulation protein R [Halobacillus sp. Marseille-Q1614]